MRMRMQDAAPGRQVQSLYATSKRICTSPRLPLSPEHLGARDTFLASSARLALAGEPEAFQACPTSMSSSVLHMLTAGKASGPWVT